MYTNYVHVDVCKSTYTYIYIVCIMCVVRVYSVFVELRVQGGEDP